MPRKGDYTAQYDEDYDEYDDDWDDDAEGEYSYDVKGDGTVSKSRFWQCSTCTYENKGSSLHCEICGVIQKPDKPDSKSKFWQCSICTYDNDESSFHCEMCGVLRVPYVNSGNVPEVKGILADSSLQDPSFLSLVSQEHAPVRAYCSTNGKGVVKNLPYDGTSDSSSVTSSTTSNSNKIKRSMSKENKDTLRRSNKAEPQTLASNLGSLKLDNSAVDRKANSPAREKTEEWLPLDQEPGTLTQLNLAIVGHVDSGKSTLSGRLLHLLGRISKKEMHKNEKEAKEKGKGSFSYAWAMDESAEERERGITMTVAVAYFDSKKYRVVLLDSPGHKDFVPNMISGTTQADTAILVIDASIGSFEVGMGGNDIGQTREHAQLIRSFGVEQIIVAINKMDVVEFSRERYEFIKLQLGSFLRSCGFKESSITWIPLSAMANQNLVTAPDDARLSCWYHGLCLLDAIDSLQPPIREISKPLCLPICDVTKSNSGQVAACGKLESGSIRNGSKVLVLPSGDLATVRSIERDSCASNTARAGDNVSISLQGIDSGNVIPGGVLCDPDSPVAVATRLELKILVLNIPMPILVGSQVEFHIHHAKEAATVVNIQCLLDPKTGKVSKKGPRVLKSKQSAIIEVVLGGEVCVEDFSKCKALGRAFLRASGCTIAVGVVTRVIE